MKNVVSIRVVFFLSVFIMIAAWELMAPRRVLTNSRKTRWFGNLVITFLNPLIVYLLFPVLTVDMAIKAHESGWGLFNILGLPYWLSLILGLAVLDFIIYVQQVIFHAITLLWRLHMMHHADLDVDVTTGLRFHPIEIVLSMGIKISGVVLIGPPAAAVLIFEVLLNATSMFNHGNIRLPLKIYRFLRYFVVTPEMHRVHHSVIIRETNSNFGFNLPWWDRLFGTYRDQPAKGHKDMTIGLSQFRDARKLTLHWLLVLPFIGDPGRQPINRH
jgi:sterol desaturase/sphingolipid hydroxylase (fatty acid hydroxylase superfamily)